MTRLIAVAFVVVMVLCFFSDLYLEFERVPAVKEVDIENMGMKCLVYKEGNFIFRSYSKKCFLTGGVF